MTKLSIVIPVYQCAGCLIELHRRLRQTLLKMAVSFEIIFVDDCGRDNSWEILSELAKSDDSVKAIKLSRNFGQHIAITAGISESCGDWVIVMDCDLQDPPEIIEKLYDSTQSGLEIVIGRRINKQHSYLRRFLSKFYFKIMDLISLHKFNHELGSFSIISRKVVKEFLQFKDKDRHYLFILYWLGFNTGYIDYEQSKRYCGTSSYSFIALLNHGINGLLFQTTTLLKWIMYLGFFVSSLGFLSALALIYEYLSHSAYPGWTSLAVLILILGGIIISSLGVVGLYISRIFEQVKERPLFVIDKKITSNN